MAKILDNFPSRNPFSRRHWDTLEELANVIQRFEDIEPDLVRIIARTWPEMPTVPFFFNAHISDTPTVITANQQWLYPVAEIEFTWSTDHVDWAEKTGGITGDATNPIEQRTVAQYEEVTTGCPTPPTDHEDAPGQLLRAPLPVGTPVRCTYVPTGGDGAKIVILHVIGQTHACAYCPEPAE